MGQVTSKKVTCGLHIERYFFRFVIESRRASEPFVLENTMFLYLRQYTDLAAIFEVQDPFSDFCH
jgi:hypothetical protein